MGFTAVSVCRAVAWPSSPACASLRHSLSPLDCIMHKGSNAQICCMGRSIFRTVQCDQPRAALTAAEAEDLLVAFFLKVSVTGAIQVVAALLAYVARRRGRWAVVDLAALVLIGDTAWQYVRIMFLVLAVTDGEGVPFQAISATILVVIATMQAALCAATLRDCFRGG